MQNILSSLTHINDRISLFYKDIPIKFHSMRIEEIDETISKNPNIWNDQSQASSLMKERNQLSYLIDKLKSMKDSCDSLLEFATLFPEEILEYEEQIISLSKDLNEFELSQMFKDPIDDSPALLSINAGAGGYEAANWVTMLLRMYLRYADSQGFKTEIIDEQRSEKHSSICTDSVSIRVEGKYAFGYLKNEAGVHRLIRNSPFNAGDAIHTSFAAIAVSPDIEDKIEIKIEDKDVDVQATRSGGSGGQAVNKISSCIILKHIPSGIQIRSQTQASQHENRRLAFKLLKSKLYELEMKKKQSAIDEKMEALTDASFGHQVRSYFLSRDQIVKDHRSEHKETNSDKVLDGDIHAFILSNLK
jgi:peptide chain release factor 2